WLTLRPGPRPLVPNGTRSSPAEPLTPEVSRATTWTPSRWPRAWASAERPAPVSVKYRSPLAPTETFSGPVRAITVRPEYTVVLMWQVCFAKQPAGIAPVPALETNALRPYTAIRAGAAAGEEAASTWPFESSA